MPFVLADVTCIMYHQCRFWIFWIKGTFAFMAIHGLLYDRVLFLHPEIHREKIRVYYRNVSQDLSGYMEQYLQEDQILSPQERSGGSQWGI